jgi:ribose-phosphate pyrophosphokinase
MNNGNNIYVCVTENKHTLAADILENLRRDCLDGEVIEIGSTLSRFKNGEQKPVLTDSVRRREIFLIWTIQEHIDTEILKLMFYVDALRRAGASHIRVLMPFFPYARQDKKKGREPISASMLARIYESIGVDHTITVHLHNAAIEGFFFNQFDKIGTQKLFLHAIENYCKEKYNHFDPKEWMLIFPDEGMAKQVRELSERIHAGGYGGFAKHRIQDNEVDKMEFFGECRGKNAIIFDDIVDTGGTLNKAGGQLVKVEGANKVLAAITHPLLNGEAPEILQNSCFEKIFVTDSVYIPKEKRFEKLFDVSLAPTLAQVIYKISRDEYISANNW